jgi:hypothetical protein
VYQVLLTAAALGKKVSGIIASPPNPGAANMCVVTYATIAF